MGYEDECVYCQRRPVDPAWRPFCGERCKLLDLRQWVDERYRVPGPAVETRNEGDEDERSD